MTSNRFMWDDTDIFDIFSDAENTFLSKYNPNHDELGRFTFASDGRRISAMPKAKPNVKRGSDKWASEIITITEKSPFNTKQIHTRKVSIKQVIKEYTMGDTFFSGKILSEYALKSNQMSKKNLHRGMVFTEKDFKDFTSQLKIGKKVSAGGSWTESLEVAKEFSDQNKSPSMTDEGDYSTLITVKKGAKGLHIAPYAVSEFKYQKEWLLPLKKMKIVSFRVVGKKVYVELEQQ